MAERIIGTFHAQAWQNDYAIPLWERAFDATLYILGMSLDDIHYIQDDSDTSDNIGREYVAHDGPCYVEIEDSISEFFAVDEVEEITAETLQAKREEYAEELARPVRRSLKMSFVVDYDARGEAGSASSEAAMYGRVMEAVEEMGRAIPGMELHKVQRVSDVRRGEPASN